MANATAVFFLLGTSGLLAPAPAEAHPIAGPSSAARKEAKARAEPAVFRPFPRQDLRFWFQNMIRDHGYTPQEVVLATGKARREVEALRKRFGLQWARGDKSGGGERAEGSILVLPYPGGRHPRIGFLEGAIHPWRESKFSMFLPWRDSGYIVVDLPEAIWCGNELIFLAHKHIPTLWDKRGLTIRRTDFRRGKAGVLSNRFVLPDGSVVATRVLPRRDYVDMELSLTNGSTSTLKGLRTQVCVMLKSARGFNGQTAENKITSGEAIAVQSTDGKRWIVTAWEGGKTWQNPPVPCMHSNPSFPDLAPGQTATVRGRIFLVTGGALKEAIEKRRKTGALFPGSSPGKASAKGSSSSVKGTGS